MTRNGTPEVLSTNCHGPNKACRAAHKAGRPVHVIPPMPKLGVDVVIVDDRAVRLTETLVMPTYHYTTAAEGIAAIEHAMKTAPTVETDEDLYAYRAGGVAHFLPLNWIDPSRR